MNNGRSEWLISLHARSNLPTMARSAGRFTFQASCRLFNFYLPLLLLFWLPIPEVLNSNSAKLLRTAHVQSLRISLHWLRHNIGRAHTSCALFNWTNEFIKGQLCYTLYSDTMHLTFFVCSKTADQACTHTHMHGCAAYYATACICIYMHFLVVTLDV